MGKSHESQNGLMLYKDTDLRTFNGAVTQESQWL